MPMSEHAKGQKKAHTGARVLTFVILVVVFSALLLFGWSQLTHRRLPRSMQSLNMGPSITVGVHGTAPSSLDIRNATDLADPTMPQDPANAALRQALIGNVYETLVSRNDSNKPVAGLAKSWRISSDGLKYTFNLNTEMRFSNGDALDSSDVLYSIKQQVNGFDAAAHANGLINLQTVTNPNPSTVVITLSAPNPMLLYALSSSSGIVYDASANTNYDKKALGSGPFTVQEFQPGDRITLTRNAMYWGSQPVSRQITVRYFADVNALKTALHNDQIQLAILKTSDSPAPFANEQSLKTVEGTSLSKVMIAFNNNTDSIVSDARARQCVRYIVDADAIAKSQAQADKLLGGPIGPLEPGYEDLTSLFPHDLQKGSDNINFFSEHYLGVSKLIAPQEYADVAKSIADQLNQTRLQVTLEVLDDDAFRSRLQGGDYTMAVTAMNQTGDAGSFANAAFGYQNSEIQQMYSTAQLATADKDYQTQMQAYGKAVSQDCAGDWLYTEHSTLVATSKIHGYHANLADQRIQLQDLATS